jgi:hypothetical protein
LRHHFKLIADAMGAEGSKYSWRHQSVMSVVLRVLAAAGFGALLAKNMTY